MHSCRVCQAPLDEKNTFPSQVKNRIHLCRPCHYKHTARMKAQNRPKELARKVVSEWRRQLKLQYGMTEADYWGLFDRQGGRCCLCGKPPSAKRKLGVEHCHETGRIRGLACIPCNTMIGIVEKVGLARVVQHLHLEPQIGQAVQPCNRINLTAR